MKLLKLSILVMATLAAQANAQNPQIKQNEQNKSIFIVGKSDTIPQDDARHKPGVVLGAENDSDGWGGTLVGSNNFSHMQNSGVLIGDHNAVNGNDRGPIVIGAGNQAGYMIRYKDNGQTKVLEKSTLVTQDQLLIGNGIVGGTSTQSAVIGLKAYAGDFAVAIGPEAHSNFTGVAIGQDSYALLDNGVALGAFSQSTTEAGSYGYNAVTGGYYSAREYTDEELATLKSKNFRDMTDADFNSMIDKVKERDSHLRDYEKALSTYVEKLAELQKLEQEGTKVFDTKEQAEAFKTKFDAATTAERVAHQAKTTSQYDMLTENDPLVQKFDQRLMAVRGTLGAVAVGNASFSRQITHMAAGTRDDDAVNVKQLKDYANATNGRLDTLETTQTEQDTKITALETTQTAQGSKIDGLTGVFATHEGKITALEAGQTAQDGKISALENHQVTQDSKIDGLTGVLAIHDGKITEIQKVNAEQDEAIKGVQDLLDEVDDRSETNKMAIKGLKQNKVDKADYEADKTAFGEKLDKEISDRKEHSKIFDERTQKNAADIATNEHNITVNEHDIGVNRQIIDETNTKVDALGGAVARHDVEIQELQQMHGNMHAINDRFNKMDKKLERGLAANAALAGLMQPYNIGRLNVTVGMGGYRSTTAIAAGAGYRFSNNVAVKAGLATNTQDFKDLTYNMSAAFEF